MAGDAALYSRILGAALDDRADGLGAQAAPWLAGLIEALEQRPVCNPRRILTQSVDRIICRLLGGCDGRAVYRDYRIVELRVPGDEQYLRLGEAWGDVDALAVQRQMIRRTIREHLDKEKRLRREMNKSVV